MSPKVEKLIGFTIIFAAVLFLLIIFIPRNYQICPFFSNLVLVIASLMKITVTIIVIWLLFRFVKAVEKIAKSMEKND
jgi:hypothetical protein